MRSRKSSQSSDSTVDDSANSVGSYSASATYDYDDQDTMCLVYPDGRTTTVTAQSNPS